MMKKRAAKLDDLDRDRYAENLEQQGQGRKHITLYDLKRELVQPYADPRADRPELVYSYRAPLPHEETSLEWCRQTSAVLAALWNIREKERGHGGDSSRPVLSDDALFEAMTGETLGATIREGMLIVIVAIVITMAIVVFVARSSVN